MGRFDGFWELKLKPWDIAAGFLVFTEEGGRATSFNGLPFDIERGEVLASNSIVHSQMVNILSTVQ